MLIDQVLYHKEFHKYGEVITNYIILFIINIVFNLLYAYIWQTLNNRYVVDVKNKLFEKSMFSKAKLLSNMDSGDIMSRIDGDADQFIHVVQKNLFHFVNSIILCLGIIVMVATINIAIAIILVIAALLPIIFTKVNSRYTEKFSKESRVLTGVISGKIFEILKGMCEIRLLNAQWWATKKIFPGIKKLIYLGNNIRKVDFIVNKGTYFINMITSIIVYGLCAFLITNGLFTVGLFLAVVEYIALLHKKFNWMLRIYLDWQVRKVSIDRVNTILESESENNEGCSINTCLNSIEFKNVTFGYEDNTVL